MGRLMQETRRTDWQSLGVIASLGFFSLAAQTLLFRVFLTVFEGNELGIACFFSSWLIWVAGGAIVGRLRLNVMTVLTNHFEFLPLLYLPACLLQWWLTGHARELAGVQPYELLPLWTMMPVSFLVSAPVSFCTGLFFTLACRWVRDTNALPVAKVYTWEAVGGAIGGIATTLLLALGVPGETVFLLSALLLTVPFAIHRLGKRSFITAAVPVLAAAAALCSGIAGRWEHNNNLFTWQRVLPPQAYKGSFTTPEARYLYGEYGEQFNVVAWETVADVIPATEHASEVIALHLAQRPGARRFLVAGRGAFSICRRLLELPQAEKITWLDPDPAYPARLLSALPERLKAGAERIETPPCDMRRWLERTRAQYDVIIMDFPDATTLALNRYFTREFFQLLKTHLAEPGVIGVRISAGENFMSEDRVNVGASVLATLRSVFQHLVLKPGEETWIMASGSPGLASAPAMLRDRYSGIQGAAGIYPPDGLMALYQPQRVEYETQCFETAVQASPADLLLNTDRAPRALLHSLLLAARETGAAVSTGSVTRAFARHGALVLPIGLLLFPLLRIVFLLRRRGLSGPAEGGPFPAFDGYVLVLTTGAVGMGSTIALMYLYQSAFGSIFLHVGLIGALSMTGLAIGSAVSSRLLTAAASPRRSSALLRCVLPAHVLLCGGIILLAAHPTHAGFAAAFMLGGLLGGVYVPLAACRLNAAGVPAATSGAWIEAVDHLGGALGGFLTGLVLLPVFGTSYGLIVLAILLLSNTAAILRHTQLPQEAGGRDLIRRLTRPLGYAMFGIAVFIMAAGLLLRMGSAEEARQAFLAFARSAAGKHELQARQLSLGNGKTLDYFSFTNTSPAEAGTTDRYVLQTDALSPEVVGYGGPITLAVVLDADGTLLDARVLRSTETPAYLDFLNPWLQRLLGGNLFAPHPLKDVDAVTGATLTSSAILRILRQAGPAFATKALGRQIGPSPVDSPHPASHRAAIWLALALAAALALRVWPSRWLRRGLLLLVVVLSGIVFNMQYSLDHVLSLFALTIPPFGWGTAFLLAAGVPLLVVIFGNVYCGYLCPFGAIQELVGDLRPAFLRTDPDKTAWAWGRLVKYLLLALVTVLFGATLQSSLASGDPLVTVFAHERSRWIICLAALLVVMAFFYPRFWCRNLCPAGAFLSLLSGLRPVRKLRPAVSPGACAYGVRDSRDMDCLCCDRCRRPGRHEQQAMAQPAGWTAARPVNAGLLAASTGLALLLAIQTVSTWRRENAEAITRGQAEMSGRGSRPVNMQRLRHLTEQGRLSDREALFYRKTVPAGPPQP